MKFKLKKKYVFYALFLLMLAFLFWLFGRSVVADGCSLSLNACLLKGKVDSFWGQMGNGVMCTFGNLGCLFGNLF